LRRGAGGGAAPMIAAIPSPPFDGVRIGPLDIRVYGLMYVVGIALAIVIARRRWEAEGGARELVYDVALWSVPAGIVGGRIYFDLTTPRFIPHHWWGPLAVWDGGLGIWGGVALGALVGAWRVRRRGAPLAAFMDAAVPGILVAQAVGRIGNWFNQELFGGPTDLPWALAISPAHRPPGYERYATFHPTFLYELIFDLALAAALVWLGHHRRIRPPGLFALYVTGYSAFRIFEELLRVDPATHLLGLRLNLFVASALTLAGGLWFTRTQRRVPAGGASRPPGDLGPLSPREFAIDASQRPSRRDEQQPAQDQRDAEDDREGRQAELGPGEEDDPRDQVEQRDRDRHAAALGKREGGDEASDAGDHEPDADDQDQQHQRLRGPLDQHQARDHAQHADQRQQPAPLAAAEDRPEDGDHAVHEQEDPQHDRECLDGLVRGDHEEDAQDEDRQPVQGHQPPQARDRAQL